MTMNSVLYTIENNIAKIALNKPEKNNAFDEQMIKELTVALKKAADDTAVKIIILYGNGKHFSAGADLNWMRKMADASLKENKQDALKLAELLYTLYHCPKPTIAQIQGANYGGGVGLIAACDIAIATDNATFCFSEVRLGLIPAVISPYVIQAIGARVAKMLFMCGRAFDVTEAKCINLIHHITSKESLAAFTQEIALNLSLLPQDAVLACKKLTHIVAKKPIDLKLMDLTANLIAEKRQSIEAKTLMKKFLTTQA